MGGVSGPGQRPPARPGYISISIEIYLDIHIHLYRSTLILLFITFQMLRGKFEGFFQQLEVGEERQQSCRDVAAPLLHKKHPQSSEVRETLQQLR